MATVKVKFRASVRPDKEGGIYYRIRHKQSAKEIHSGYRVFPCEWDPIHEQIELPEEATPARKEYLRSLNDTLHREIVRLNDIIRNLELSGKESYPERIIERFRRQQERSGFVAFAEELINRLKQCGKERTAETYTTVLNRFIRFRKHEEVSLEELDSNLMTAYETHLKASGCCPNTTSFYMRNLRAMYNRAVDCELIPQHFPFKHVYTGVDKTVKRALPLKVIRRIRDLDLTGNASMEFARDMFLFAFYTRGMSFIDMAYLKKKDLRDGILTYRRQKTKQRLVIKWESPMQQIIDKYDTNDSPYLLPIVRDPTLDVRKQYKNTAHLVHNRLRKIGQILELSTPLTCYVARHSWASAAKSMQIPLSVISEAMGHDSEKTTRIYLAALDSELVDKANLAILSSL